MARDRGRRPAAVDDEVMALGLAADGLVDGIHQGRVIAFVGTQRGAQVRSVHGDRVCTDPQHVFREKVPAERLRCVRAP